MKKIFTLIVAICLFTTKIFAAQTGDYKTNSLTNLLISDWKNTLTWLKFNGLLWLTELDYPGKTSSTANVEISNAIITINAGDIINLNSLTITGNGSLYLSSSTSITLNVTNNLSVTGTLALTNLTGSKLHNINVSGSFLIDANANVQLFNGDDYTNLNLNGNSNKLISIGDNALVEFYNLTINKTVSTNTITNSNNPFVVKNKLYIQNGNLILSATSNKKYIVDKDLVIESAGTLTHNVSYNNGDKLLEVGGDVQIVGKYIYTGYEPALCMVGTGSRQVKTTSSSLCKLLLLNGDFYANGKLTVDKDFYAMWNNSSGSFHTNNNEVNANWGLVNSGGKVFIDGGTLNISGANGGLLIGRTTNQNGEVVMSGGTLNTVGIYVGSQTASPSTNAIFTLNAGTISTTPVVIGYNSKFLQSGGTANLSSLNCNYSTSIFDLNASASPILKITGNITNNGTIQSSGTSDLELSGSITNNGTLQILNGNTLTLKGATSQSIAGTNATTFGKLIINTSAGVVVTVNTPITINHDLSIISGSLNLNNFTCNRSSAGGIFSMSSGTLLQLTGSSGGTAGSNFPANFSNYTFNENSTVEYKGGNQTIAAAPAYGHLSLLNVGNKTAPNSTLTIKGNFTNTGSTFKHNKGKILLSGLNQQFAGLDFYELELANGGTKTMLSSTSAEKLLKITNATTFSLGNNDFRLLSNDSTTAAFGEFPVGASLVYGTGKFVVERFMPAKKVWRFVATPIKSGTSIYDTWQTAGAVIPGYGVEISGPGAVPLVNGLDINSYASSMKYYDAATAGEYIGITNTKTTSLANDRGYMIFVRGDRTSTGASGTNTKTILNTRGELITGDKSYSVPANGFASVGNPYASRIDLRTVFANAGIGTSSGVTATVSIWDPLKGAGANGVGLYRTYTRNNDGNFEQTPSGVINNFIESGQAFFVQSTTGGIFKLQENVKSQGSANASRESSGLLQRLRTNLYSNLNNTTSLLDGTLIDTEESFSNAIDNMDVVKTFNTGENICIVKGTKQLIVERHNHFSNSDTIQFKLSALKQQGYILEFVPENLEIKAGLIAMLEDSFLKTSSVLSLTDTSRIQFQVSAATTSSVANRFRIIFKTISVLPVTITKVTTTRNQNQQIQVQWKVDNELGITKYIVERSANGQQFFSIAEQLANNSSTYQYTDIQHLIGDSYYRILAIGNDGKKQYSAIVKLNGLKALPQISVYPNPVVDKIIQLQLNDFKNGTYPLQIHTVTGQLIYSGNLEVTTNNMVKPISLKDAPAGVYVISVNNKEMKTKKINVIIK